MPVGVAIIALLVPLAFAFATLALHMSMQDNKPISYAQEAALRDRLFEQFKSQRATDVASCPNYPTLDAQHNFEYNNIRITRTGDRAVYRYCNENGLLLAKTSDDTWFAVGDVDPRPQGAQDYKTRKVCKIEDITLGFNDTFPENASLRDIMQKACHDIDATYKIRM